MKQHEIIEYGELFYHVQIEYRDQDFFFDETLTTKLRCVLNPKVKLWLTKNFGQQIRWTPAQEVPYSVTSDGYNGTNKMFAVFVSPTSSGVTHSFYTRTAGNWGVDQNSKPQNYNWQSFYFRRKEDSDLFYSNWASYVRMMS